MFFKIGTLENFAIFTGKHLCWGLFLIKLCRGVRPNKKVGKLNQGSDMHKRESLDFCKKSLCKQYEDQTATNR